MTGGAPGARRGARRARAAAPAAAPRAPPRRRAHLAPWLAGLLLLVAHSRPTLSQGARVRGVPLTAAGAR
jgi:hypothetical protein